MHGLNDPLLPFHRSIIDAAAGSRQGPVMRSGVRLSSRLPASGQSGVWVVGREPVSGVVVDEGMVSESIDGAALGSNVTQCVPGSGELGMVLIERSGLWEEVEPSIPTGRASGLILASLNSTPFRYRRCRSC